VLCLRLRRACGLSSLLATEPCNVFSLGSHGQVDFEEAVRDRYPHCRLFVYDHTLDDKQRAAVLAVNGERTASSYTGLAVTPGSQGQHPLSQLAGTTSRCSLSANLTASPY